MIGNDLCCRKISRSNSRNKRYLEKITTAQERRTLSALDDHLQVPFSWSIKESAYKYCRQYLPVSANPKTFEIQKIRHQHGEQIWNGKEVKEKGFANVEHWESIVQTSLGTLIGKSLISDDFIHAVLSGSAELLEQMFWGLALVADPSYQQQSTGVRKNAIDHFLKIKETENVKAEFRKNENKAPVLFLDEIQSESVFSFSHDQQYVGYAWFTP